MPSARPSAGSPRLESASGVRRVSDLEDQLFAEELAAVAAASPQRRHQFATGRVLLREVIGHDGPIPMAADRRMVLPPGVVASLAHDDRIAVAVAASSSALVGLGVDVEPLADLDADEAALIIRPDDEVDDPLVAFVAKEAAYKAWSRPGRPILDHHDVRLTAQASGMLRDY